MSGLSGWLAEGDLRSDGFADEAVRFIQQNPGLAGDLLAMLDHPDPVVRAHGADALEKLARTRPDLIKPALGRLIAVTERPEPAAVRMHMAMMLGHLAADPEVRPTLLAPLLKLLDEPGAFSRCWAISSLCILGRLEPAASEQIMDCIAALRDDPSIAVRTRVRKASPLLADRQKPFPRGWIKSDHLKDLEGAVGGENQPGV